MDVANQQSARPSIQDAMDKFDLKFHKAIAGNEITGNVSGSLRRFLEEPSLPPYYQMKAYLALSGADEENEPWENLAACRYFLREAEKALKEAQEIYVHEIADVEVLVKYEQIIREEWDALHVREKEADSDSENDDDDDEEDASGYPA